ncbi:hypothetical protein L3Q82_002744 [Scortum barcoo]|uniref:Uncharacterized protein n=1 Tax=Scortum barcoo TaxID=214431 RepID=A0ACB8VUF4_9TELE|nr:hypothetical protein L3Q82_002744 [Scortum barcoo]
MCFEKLQSESISMDTNVTQLAAQRHSGKGRKITDELWMKKVQDHWLPDYLTNLYFVRKFATDIKANGNVHRKQLSTVLLLPKCTEPQCFAACANMEDGAKAAQWSALSEVTGQTKSGSQAHHEQKNIKDRYVARIGVTGAPPWSQAWGWGSQASAWWPGLCPRDPAGLSPSLANGDVGPPSSRLTTTRRKVHEGPVQCGLGSSRGRGASTTQSLDQNSGNRDMECHLAGGEGA